MKSKLRKILRFILNPRLLMCIAIAWLITNRWSYILFVLGNLLDIHWMVSVSGAYIAFLWLPVSPEKIVTFALAILLLRLLFPNDQKTLAVLEELYAKARSAFKARRKSGSHQEEAAGLQKEDGQKL